MKHRRVRPEVLWLRGGRDVLRPINREIGALQARAIHTVALGRRAGSEETLRQEIDTVLCAANALVARIERCGAEVGPEVASTAPFQNAMAALKRLKGQVAAARGPLPGAPPAGPLTEASPPATAAEA
jgi:hypothetical protein